MIVHCSKSVCLLMAHYFQELILYIKYTCLYVEGCMSALSVIYKYCD